jgi:hypothetical protein
VVDVRKLWKLSESQSVSGATSSTSEAVAFGKCPPPTS